MIVFGNIHIYYQQYQLFESIVVRRPSLTLFILTLSVPCSTMYYQQTFLSCVSIFCLVFYIYYPLSTIQPALCFTYYPSLSLFPPPICFFFIDYSSLVLVCFQSSNDVFQSLWVAISFDFCAFPNWFSKNFVNFLISHMYSNLTHSKH